MSGSATSIAWVSASRTLCDVADGGKPEAVRTCLYRWRMHPDTELLPGRRPYDVAIPAPGPGPQHWAGAPSAAVEDDGSIVLSYRRRDAPGVDALVIARSADGVQFQTTAELLPAMSRCGDDGAGSAAPARR